MHPFKCFEKDENDDLIIDRNIIIGEIVLFDVRLECNNLYVNGQ